MRIVVNFHYFYKNYRMKTSVRFRNLYIRQILILSSHLFFLAWDFQLKLCTHLLLPPCPANH
jgi:hypothetical protein